MAFYRKSKGGVTRIVRDTYSSKGQSWYEIADRVRKRDQFTCQDPSCRKYLGPGRGPVHHIIPLSRGGTTTMSNLILICNECHEKRHTHLHRKAHAN